MSRTYGTSITIDFVAHSLMREVHKQQARPGVGYCPITLGKLASIYASIAKERPSDTTMIRTMRHIVTLQDYKHYKLCWARKVLLHLPFIKEADLSFQPVPMYALVDTTRELPGDWQVLSAKEALAFRGRVCAARRELNKEISKGKKEPRKERASDKPARGG